MIGAGFGLGFTLGPAPGGLLGGIDPRLPFRVAGGLAQSIARGAGLHVPGMAFHVAEALLVLSGIIAWQVTRPRTELPSA